MLQINDLSITQRKDSHALLSGFSFSLCPGDKAAIIGEEGNGKSTLLKLIYDPTLVEDYAEYSGEILRGDTVFGYLAQELSPAEETLSAAEFCGAQSGFSSLSQKKIASLAAGFCLDIGLFSETRRMSTLSGGEKVKLRMVCLLAKSPDVLLLDEPTNDVDIDTLEWMERFIAESRTPVLFISHDETLLERTANVVIHIEQLRRKTLPRAVTARLPYRQYVDRRLSAFEHQEQAARSDERDYRSRMERFRKIQSSVEYQQAHVSRQDPHAGKMLKRKMQSVKSMGKRFEREHEEQTPMLEGEDAILLRFGEGGGLPNGKSVLRLRLPELTAGGKTLAENIELDVVGPEKICITGANGAGKTTLLRIIAGELLGRRDLRAAYMPQNYAELLDGAKTPVEFLAERGGKEEATRARTYLGSIKFTPGEMEHPAAELSGGQKAKLFFAKLALGDYNVLVLDEPTRNLSPLSGPEVRSALSGFRGAVISVSHDRKFIAEVCNKVYELREGGLALLRR